MSYDKPYDGLRVVDLSQGIAGPYCAMLLAQYGADVIKVEPPEGDWARQLGRRVGDHTAFSIAGNLGKRSIVLDLKEDEDKQQLFRLLERADVFLEGFRPGVIERLGFGYDTAAARNPRLIYLSVSGYGQVGPLNEKPAMDPILQAFTGFMTANRDAHGNPQRIATIPVDMATALYCFQAVSAALYARQSEDRGRRIDVSLMQGAANLQVVRMMQTHLFGEQPKAATAPSGCFPCKAGHLFIVILQQADFVTFCGLTGLDEMAGDRRFRTPLERMHHQEELNRRVADVLKTKTASEWNDLLTAHGLQNERILEYGEFLDHPQVDANDLISWLAQPGVEGAVPLPNPPGTPHLVSGTAAAHAPRLGEHTSEVLAELNAEK